MLLMLNYYSLIPHYLIIFMPLLLEFNESFVILFRDQADVLRQIVTMHEYIL